MRSTLGSVGDTGIKGDIAKCGQDIGRSGGDGEDPGGIKRDSREIQGDPRRYKKIRERQKIRGRYMDIQDARYRKIY
jgi:hypothetical protein